LVSTTRVVATVGKAATGGWPHAGLASTDRRLRVPFAAGMLRGMARTRRGRRVARLIEGSAAVGLVVGWRIAAAKPQPLVACARGTSPGGALAQCVNRSLAATVTHWGVPMVESMLVAAAVASVIVLAVARMRGAIRRRRAVG
jgi:hypothetical protein